ncbi:MAG TPA: glycosyltransferase [Rhizomicrobium sp.]|nr:glycosyltransferase [Rhizomicrobium sp.]
MGSGASPKSWAGGRIAVLSPTPTHPQDFGNRKRIFRVCSRYAEQGAAVTFIHYPAELEWRAQIPRRAERAMASAWSQYFTVAPTRLLHTDPKGRHHGIDEWWDPSIGEFLMWLFSVQSFDAFIVNYSWLSKALEFAPRSTFRILDTHDKFSGRRGMLESLGLDAEFFYTTEDEERIALDRADLVWAIKREEAAELARMTRKPVLALPHLDPFTSLARPAPDRDGYLRVGVIGARNNVNRMNITSFLNAAEPIFLNAFAPVKIVIAGSVCSLLEGIASPFVELMGRVENVEDFYSAVDCVAVPMRTSTGLKIKTGEALSLGMPVLSLAHAFEGYEAADPLHKLADFADMARAIVDLSFAARGRLDMLADASRRAHERTAAIIADAFSESDRMVRENGRQFVVAADSRAFVPGSIFNLLLRAMHDDLATLGAVTVLVVKGSAKDIAANPESLDRFRRVAVADDLAGAEALRDDLADLGATVFGVSEFLERMRPAVLFADALHPVLMDGPPETVVFARTDAIALSEGRDDFALPVDGYGRAYVVAPCLSPALAARIAALGIEHVRAPCFWRASEVKFARARDMSGNKVAALLGDADAPAMALATGMARAWGLTPLAIAAPQAGAYIAGLVEGRIAPPAFVVDLSHGQPGLPVLRELLDRLHVPAVVTSGIGLPPSLHVASPPLRARTESELWKAMRALAVEPETAHAAALKQSWSDLESDRGWAWIAQFCARLIENHDAQFV